MSRPNSRSTLIQYCLRKLGHPVIDINIDDDQISDCVDDALQMFEEYHFDGVERIFLKHQITADDITNEYITISNAVIGIKKIFPIGSSGSSSSSFFSVDYQFMQDEVWNIGGGDLIHYDMVTRNIALMQNLFLSTEQFAFHRHKNQLTIEMKWSELSTGNYLIIECYRILDPNTYTDVYNDMFLKRYLTALMKKQWGSNLKKYEGLILPGGVTFSGQSIFDEASTEIDTIEEEMTLKYELPIDFEIG